MVLTITSTTHQGRYFHLRIQTISLYRASSLPHVLLIACLHSLPLVLLIACLHVNARD